MPELSEPLEPLEPLELRTTHRGLCNRSTAGCLRQASRSSS